MTDLTKCRRYEPETDSFDKCNFNQLEDFYVKVCGCSVPYLPSAVPVCSNHSLILKVISKSIVNSCLLPFADCFDEGNHSV